MLEHDFVATRQSSGQYVIQQFLANRLMPVPGHEGTYDDAEVQRRLAALRPEGDGWIDEGNGIVRLVQP